VSDLRNLSDDIHFFNALLCSPVSPLGVCSVFH